MYTFRASIPSPLLPMSAVTKYMKAATMHWSPQHLVMPAQGKCWTDIYRMSKQVSKQWHEHEWNKNHKREKISILLEKDEHRQVPMTGPHHWTTCWVMSRMRKGSCLHFWVPESPKLCHSTTCHTRLNLNAQSALDRNNSREKGLRRHLSLVQTFLRAKEVDWATCTPGWVAVGL